jgi:hypothetical protein
MEALAALTRRSTDSPSKRTLSGASQHDDTGMSNEACAAFCDSQGYTMFGTEYARECYCGYYPDTQSLAVQPDGFCGMTCTGAAGEACGAAGYISVYCNYKPEPTVQQDSLGYQYLGCYSDDPKSKSLAHGLQSSQTRGLMTVDMCTNLCFKAGYGLAGLEYGDECWCDNKLSSSAQIQSAAAGYTPCNMACKGNDKLWCGGQNAMSL